MDENVCDRQYKARGRPNSCQGIMDRKRRAVKSILLTKLHSTLDFRPSGIGQVDLQVSFHFQMTCTVRSAMLHKARSGCRSYHPCDRIAAVCDPIWGSHD
jgi:hypothetical protein